jgi:uncharacterized protein YidB (DUF937 family)
MGTFDDGVQGKTVAKPLMLGLGALLIGKITGGVDEPDAPVASSATGPVPQSGSGLDAIIPDRLVGGLGSLLERLTSAGLGDLANSWVGPGRNRPIRPKQLGSALGQTAVTELARHSGMSEQQLLAQLSRVLPGVVDKLTPDGRVPDPSEIATRFGLGS